MFHVVIPARFAASRLPGKPLLLIGDRPLIQWVWQSARASGAASVIIATDDVRIFDAATRFGADCLMTSAKHVSGTDRIAEVARVKSFAADDIVVNLQGDEPMMPAAVIGQIAEALAARPQIDIATAVAPILSVEEFLDPSCVKALRAPDGSALYFSRAPVPWPRDSVTDGRADALCRRLAAHRHLRLPGAQPAEIRILEADAARGDRKARAVARVGARHADSPGHLPEGAARRGRYAERPRARARRPGRRAHRSAESLRRRLTEGGAAASTGRRPARSTPAG